MSAVTHIESWKWKVYVCMVRRAPVNCTLEFNTSFVVMLCIWNVNLAMDYVQGSFRISIIVPWLVVASTADK
jgi:hypothetical protein